MMFAGKRFDSKAEGNYYMSLAADLDLELIKDFECQPVIQLSFCKYIPDFKITRLDDTVFFVDVKSEITRKQTDYRLKIKALKAEHPDIEFVEICDGIVDPQPLKPRTVQRMHKLIEEELRHPIILPRDKSYV
jgi:hypothetical protein